MNTKIRPASIAVSVLLAALVFLIPLGLAPQPHAVLAITILMGMLWLSEALPLHVTALLGTVLFIFAGIDPAAAFTPYFNPTIALFFGGFVLARAMQKHGLDRRLVSTLLSWFGPAPPMFLLGLMLATGFLSLWISNTATAAIMMPLAVVTFRGIRPGRSSYAKAAVLGVAFAATIGGIGSLVGTPPNAITVADLAEHGIQVTFFDWAAHALPFVIIFLPVSWLVILLLYPPDLGQVVLPLKKAMVWTPGQKSVLAIGLFAVALWMTSSYHHVPDSAIAIIMVIFLYLAGAVETMDMRLIDWPVLLLLGGSMSMGAAVLSSGLASQIGSLLAVLLSGQAQFQLFATISLFGVLVTSLMSNTSTAALLVPIISSLPAMAGAGVKQLAMMAGMSASFNFITPAGTPPNAMAYSSGQISVWDMAKAGVPLTILAMLLLSLLAWLFW
ncbi:MAG: DASS family sodium-coupled anion symporter [Candidatus ainarchaeum sp.]|nr:DASS family sodium-coupled anion symporter [Candidatus ainarchaeum sp.]